MTREECEAKILEKLKEIDKIHKEYNPNAKYLTLAIMEDSYFFHNEYWSTDGEPGPDADTPLNKFESINKEDKEDE